MDFFMTLVAERVESDNTLRRVNALMELAAPGGGSQPDALASRTCPLIRVLLLGLWLPLLDRELECPLKMRLDEMGI